MAEKLCDLKKKGGGGSGGNVEFTDGRLFWSSTSTPLTVASKQGKKFICMSYQSGTAPTFLQNGVALTASVNPVSTPDKINFSGSYSSNILVWQGTILTNSDTFKTDGSNGSFILMAIE